MSWPVKRAAAAILLLAAAAAAIIAAWEPLGKIWREAMRLPDENGIYRVGEQWFEELPELNEKSVAAFADKLDTLQSDLLTAENRCFYAIIPDKSWYVREEGYQTLDQERLLALLRGELTGNFTEIDLSSALDVDSYYASDLHWRQEKLQPVLDKLGEAMDFSVKLDNFTEVQHTPFLGSMKQYLAESGGEEALVYLTSADTEAAVSDNYQHPDITAVYDLAKLETDNSYDLFLSGVSPLITIDNPLSDSGRELVIFRDSFGSSLAPLLLGEYDKITLIDLRFIFSTLLPDYVTFDDQDVLFLYNSRIVNNSGMLR